MKIFQADGLFGRTCLLLFCQQSIGKGEIYLFSSSSTSPLMKAAWKKYHVFSTLEILLKTTEDWKGKKEGKG